MSKFQPGDRVRCIDASDTPLRLGDVYVVDRYTAVDTVFLVGIPSPSFFAERFEIIPESVTNAPDAAAAELEKIGKLLDDCGFISAVSVLARVRELMRRHATNNAEVWKGLAERLALESLIDIEVRK